MSSRKPRMVAMVVHSDRPNIANLMAWAEAHAHGEYEWIKPPADLVAFAAQEMGPGAVSVLYVQQTSTLVQAIELQPSGQEHLPRKLQWSVRYKRLDRKSRDILLREVRGVVQ